MSYPPQLQAPPPYQGYPPPDPGHAPAHRRTRTGRRLALLICAGLAVLCAGGAVGSYLLLRHTANPATTTPRTRLVTPATINGRARVIDPQIQAGLDQGVAAMRKSGATSVVGAAYGDLAKRDLLVVIGEAHPVSDPAKALDEYLAGMRASGMRATKLAVAAPGPLGGVAKCGDAVVAGLPTGLCVWADQGSFGAVMVYFKPGAVARAQFPGVRAAVEHRG